MIRDAIEAAEAAAGQAAPRLTALLRYNAVQAGWSPQAVSSLVVKTDPSGMLVEGNDAALQEEYGDAEARPKPAVRQFANRRDAIDQQILLAAQSRLRGLL